MSNRLIHLWSELNDNNFLLFFSSFFFAFQTRQFHWAIVIIISINFHTNVIFWPEYCQRPFTRRTYRIELFNCQLIYKAIHSIFSIYLLCTCVFSILYTHSQHWVTVVSVYFNLSLVVFACALSPFVVSKLLFMLPKQNKREERKKIRLLKIALGM